MPRTSRSRATTGPPDDFGAADEPAEVTAEEPAIAERARSVSGAVADHDLLYGRADFLRDENDDLQLTELEVVEPSISFGLFRARSARLRRRLAAGVRGPSPS